VTFISALGVQVTPPEGTDIPKPDDEDNGFGTIGKLLSGGLATLITVAAAVGAATGGLAFLMRNASTQIKLALLLSGIAVVLAGVATIWPATSPSRSWWGRSIVLFGSSVLLGVSFWLIFDTQERLLAQSSRPDIISDWATIGDSLTLRVTINADALARDDQLYSAVVAVGQRPSKSGSPSTAPATASSQAPLNQTFTLYSGSAGPNSDGHGQQIQTVVVPTEIEGYRVDSLQIAAVVLKREKLTNALNSAAATPSPSAASGGQAAPAPTPLPRILSLDCNGQLKIADAATGTQITQVDSTSTPACVNLSALPQPSTLPTS